MFKKNLFSVIVVCTIIVTAQAMDNGTKLPLTIKLPSAEKLRSYLSKGGLWTFVERTNIDRFLDSRELNPLKLFTIVSDYVDHYAQDLQNEAQRQRRGVGFQIVEDSAPLKKEQVLKCILHESPDVYNKLLAFDERLAKL